MKKTLRLLLAASSALMLQQQSHAQVTLISNNTNITTGYVLTGSNRPIMEDDDGGLWTTNGTTATKVTTAVTHSSTTGAALYNNMMYFGGVDAGTQDVELWATDATAGGTKLIANIAANGSSEPSDFFVFNNTLYFSANDGVNGRELWKTNGQVGNATMVADISDGSESGLAEDSNSFFQNGNNVFFAATSGGSTGLWKLDQAGSVSLLKNIAGDISVSFFDCAALGNNTVFTVRTGDIFNGAVQLWVTDGTPNGTVLLKDFGIGSGFISPQLTQYNGVLFFQGYASNSGIELWTTDGTPANTKLFKDLDPKQGNSSYPYLYISALIEGRMFFGATTEANGFELWVTDGTPAGTTLFKDINTKNNGREDASPLFLTNIGAYANLTSGNVGSINFQQANSTKYNGKWYFIADDGTHGMELWSTDGTPENTNIVKDLNPGLPDGTEFSNVAYYTTTGIYFMADNGSTGTEPFVTDGSDNGTRLVADINTKSKTGSDPSFLFLYNSQIYLNADNGDNTQGNTDLYKINQSVTVLPVNLLSFNVALRDGSVALNWITASEVNTSNFVIERSTDAVHFSEVGMVAAAGNSNSARQYQFADAGALQAGASTLYYRLRIVDKDGRYSYTAILPVALQGGMFKIVLLPSPVKDRLTVTFSTNNAKSITLRVTDANGKAVYQQQFEASGATTMQQNINVARFAAGSYFVQLITDKGTKTARFMKQ